MVEDTTDDTDAPADRVDTAEDEAESGRRDVEVPLSLYKVVTVSSTLIAVVTVVGGFVLLDAATDRGQAAVSEIDPLVAVAGLALILIGAATYAYATRFRAEGMGTGTGRSKDDSDEPSEHG